MGNGDLSTSMQVKALPLEKFLLLDERLLAGTVAVHCCPRPPRNILKNLPSRSPGR